MAIIYSYPQGSSALKDDRLIITRIDEEENEITTKQLTLGQIAEYIIETSPVVSGTGTPNYITMWGSGGGSIVDSPIYTENTKVGIGNTDPSETLDVTGNILATGTILGSNLSGINTGDQDLSVYLLNTTDTFTGDLTVTGTTTVQGTGDSSFAGNVGIGTASPGDELEVVGNAKISGRVDTSQVRIEGANRTLVLTKSSTVDSHIAMVTTGESDGFISSKNDHIVIGGTNGYSANNLNIKKANGYVGIKQKAPLAPLHVKMNGEAIRLESTGDNICSIDFRQGTNKRGHIEYSNSNDTLEIKTENPTGSTSKLKFSVAENGQLAEEVMRIQYTPSVLKKQVIIGNPDGSFSGATLYVKGDIETTSTLRGVNISISGRCDVDSYKLKGLNTPPATRTSPGVVGEIRYTADYIYVCVQNNVWKRTALTSW